MQCPLGIDISSPTPVHQSDMLWEGGANGSYSQHSDRRNKGIPFISMLIKFYKSQCEEEQYSNRDNIWNPNRTNLRVTHVSAEQYWSGGVVGLRTAKWPISARPIMEKVREWGWRLSEVIGQWVRRKPGLCRQLSGHSGIVTFLLYLMCVVGCVVVDGKLNEGRERWCRRRKLPAHVNYPPTSRLNCPSCRSHPRHTLKLDLIAEIQKCYYKICFYSMPRIHFIPLKILLLRVILPYFISMRLLFLIFLLTFAICDAKQL